MVENHKFLNKNVFLTCFFMVTLVTIIVYGFESGISGNDFWWHVKTGEYICNNHLIPKSDIFSWIGIEKGISWTAHEWLSDVIFYCIFSAFGEIGIYLFSLILSFSMVGLILWQSKEYIKTNMLIGGLFLCLFAVICGVFFYGRPHIFSFFLLFAELKILYTFVQKKDSHGIFFLPLISVLWSNLHGGSSNLSYILCFLFLAVGLINIKVGKIESERMSKNDLIKLSIITLLTVSAIFVNPIGLKVFLYPYESFADNISMTVISEWHAPDAKNIGELILYYLPIGIITLSLLSYEKRIRLVDVAVMGLFLLLFFRSARFIILWYIAASFYALRYIPKLDVKTTGKAWEKIALSIISLLMLVIMSFSFKHIIKATKADNLISTAMSDEAINFVKEDNPSRLFNDYNFGETLIYNGIPVYFDARADLFAQENIMANGVSMLLLEATTSNNKTDYIDVNGFIKENKIDSILILKDRPLYSFLISHPDKYKKAFEDEQTVYFKVIK